MTYEELKQKYQPYLDYKAEYAKVKNAATGSKVDANANVNQKNIATLSNELTKTDIIGMNRLITCNRLTEMFGKEVAQRYLDQLDQHLIYRHDESHILPYCVSITMYPFLFNGLETLGGSSKAPKHLSSFCGEFVNLVFAVAAQFAGAVSTPEFLSYMDYFLRKDYGDDYYLNPDKVVDLSNRHLTIDNIISDSFQQVVYSINQPAAARGCQCVRADHTQLWTPDGYKYLHELKEGDLCYVWKDGKYSVEPIRHLNVYDYDGELIQFYGPNYQQTVTPNHRVVYRASDNSGRYMIKTAEEVEHHVALDLPIRGELDRPDYPVDDDMLKLATYALTDSTFKGRDATQHYRLIYTMSPNRKGHDGVLQALSNKNIPYVIDEHKGKFGPIDYIRILYEDAKPIFELINNRRDDVPDFFLKLSRRQARIVLECWANTDGQHLRGNKDRMRLQCDNMNIADKLQQVASIAGVGSLVKYRKTSKFGTKDHADTLYVETSSRETRWAHSRRVPYKGKVWCPTTDAGIVIFREDDKMAPYITGNSVFWNIAYFDHPYFDGMFSDFVFPDGSAMKWESVSWLQKRFMNWFNEERLRVPITFPVETLDLLDDGEKYVDEEWADFAAEMWSKGHSFFMYRSNSVDSLSSCCRLRNELQDNTFSYTLGAGGVSTGSKCVITMNINRLVQNAKRDGVPISDAVRKQTRDIHQYLLAVNEAIKEDFQNHMLTAYDAGYISLDKQYLTVGVNGFVEGAEFLGIPVQADSEEYAEYCNSILEPIYNLNKAARTKEIMMNCEFVPRH